MSESGTVSTEKRVWTASQYLDDGRWGVLTEDGGIVVSVRSKDGQLSHEDAQLIAAAPDLLALARQLASECAGCGGSAEIIRGNGPDPRNEYAVHCPDCADIWSVINKAEGR